MLFRKAKEVVDRKREERRRKQSDDAEHEDLGYDETLVIGEGIFRKEGQGVKSWKERKYAMTLDGKLYYCDPHSGEVKGSLSVSSCLVHLGNAAQVKASGYSCDGISLCLHAISDSRKLNVSFENTTATKSFLRSLASASKDKNNIEVLCASQGWQDIVTVGHTSANGAEGSSSSLEDVADRTNTDSPSTPVDSHPSTLAATVVGEGKFRKLGSNVKNWKQRHYIILNNGNLRYYDIGEVKSAASAAQDKGIKEFCLASITLEEGSERNLTASGCADFSAEHGVAITITSFGIHIKVLDVVFDTIKEAKVFVQQVKSVSSSHNVEKYLAIAVGKSLAPRSAPVALKHLFSSKPSPNVAVAAEEITSADVVTPLEKIVIKEDDDGLYFGPPTCPEGSSSEVIPSGSTDPSHNAASVATSVDETIVTEDQSTSENEPIIKSRSRESMARAGKRSSITLLTGGANSSLAAPSGLLVGEGCFRKQGSGVIKSWKKRRYTITDDYVLCYYEMLSDVVKGSLNTKNVCVSLGSEENVTKSGAVVNEDGGTENLGSPVALDIKSLADNRTLECVFDTKEDAVIFVKQLSKATIMDNIAVFINQPGWMIDLAMSRSKEITVAAREHSLPTSFATLVKDTANHTNHTMTETVTPQESSHINVNSLSTFSSDNVVKDIFRSCNILLRKLLARDILSIGMVIVWLFLLCNTKWNPSMRCSMVFGVYSLVLVYGVQLLRDREMSTATHTSQKNDPKA